MPKKRRKDGAPDSIDILKVLQDLGIVVESKSDIGTTVTLDIIGNAVVQRCNSYPKPNAVWAHTWFDIQIGLQKYLGELRSRRADVNRVRALDKLLTAISAKVTLYQSQIPR